MGENSKIEWTDHTWNAWIGCEEINPACDHCYAREMAQRYGWAKWGPDGTRRITAPSNWRKPITWNAKAAKEGNRYRVFCESLSDLFEDWQGAMRNHKGTIEHRCGEGHRIGLETIHVEGIECDSGCGLLSFPWSMLDVRAEVFALIDETPNLDWLLLTKRPENINRFWSAYDSPERSRPNVWLGTSIPNQEWADKLVPELLRFSCLGAGAFLSVEPLLGPIDLEPYLGNAVTWNEDGSRCWEEPGINWVIAGGESGSKARPCHPDWIRSLRDQCQAAGVPFFFKQWGEWVPESHDAWTSDAPQDDSFVEYVYGDQPNPVDYRGTYMAKVGKEKAVALLDGREWKQTPFAKEHT